MKPQTPQPTRPAFLTVDPTGIPPELAARDHWMAWKAEYDERTDSWKKPPINPHTGRKADATNRANHGTLDQALARMKNDNLDGVGYVFRADDPYVGIDLDEAVAGDGSIEPRVAAILDRIDSYSEPSPSGTGLHIIVQSQQMPEGGNRLQGIETYWTDRFFTVVGQPLSGKEDLKDCTDPYLAWHEEVFQRATDSTPRPQPRSDRIVSSASPQSAEEDEAIIATCRRMSPKFPRLFDEGDLRDYEGDWSRGDQALLAYLVKAGVTDEAALDRIFRKSGLMRQKWLRNDYRDRTIRKALSGAVVPGVSTLPESEQLKQKIARLQRQLQAAEDRAQGNGETIRMLTAIQRNSSLNGERAVAQVLVTKFACFESCGIPRPYRISVKEVAECAGISRSTAAKHIAAFASAGLLQRSSELTPGRIDRMTGELVPPQTITRITPTGSTQEFAAAVANLDGKSDWGGRRPNSFGRGPDRATTRA